jgi:riboflavin biosynthesis pyrimidine reductase
LPATIRAVTPDAVAASPKITWHLDRETRFPFGRIAPDPLRDTALGFPPPWPDRPWIFGVMVTSANGVVAWRRRTGDDDPVLAILGGGERPRDRAADKRLMRHLRTFGDLAVGAQTTRDQPELVQTPQEPGEPPVPELYRFRTDHGLPYQPRTVVYSLFGRLRLDSPLFNTPGLDVIVVTTDAGAAEIEERIARRSRRRAERPDEGQGPSAATPIRRAGRSRRRAERSDEGQGPDAGKRHIRLIVEPSLDVEGLRRAHERLFADRGVRYLDCEGGMTVLHALHGAGLLDEVFVTTTDIEVDADRHEGVQSIFDFEGEDAELVAEGRIEPDGRFMFRRWRFNRR